MNKQNEKLIKETALEAIETAYSVLPGCRIIDKSELAEHAKRIESVISDAITEATSELEKERDQLRSDLESARKQVAELRAIAKKFACSVRDFPCGHKPNGVGGKCEACEALKEYDAIESVATGSKYVSVEHPAIRRLAELVGNLSQRWASPACEKKEGRLHKENWCKACEGIKALAAFEKLKGGVEK